MKKIMIQQKHRNLSSIRRAILVATAFIIGAGAFLPVHSVTAAETEAGGILGSPLSVSLAPGAPHWADKASGVVWYRFTTQGQAMLRAAKQMPPPCGTNLD
jgi:hypothetical protein